MIKVEITRQERAELDRLMKQFAKTTKAETKSALSSAGLRMETVSKEKAPVGTPQSTGIPGYKGGTLRQSLLYEPVDSGMGARVATPVKYAVYQNNGTSRIKGKRFMEAGLKAGIRELQRILGLR